MADPDRAPPDGFVLSVSRGKFTTRNGPVYTGSADGDVRSGMWVLDRHCNGMGFLHGGMASAFADRALAMAVFDSTRKMSVTLKLTMEFFRIVREGEWLEAVPTVKSVDDDIVHVMAKLNAGGQFCARADAQFRLLRRTAK